MELQFRAVPWTTNSGAGGATWPWIIGELQLRARAAINAGLTLVHGLRTRMNPSTSHLDGSLCDLTEESDPARVAEQVDLATQFYLAEDSAESGAQPWNFQIG